MAYYNNTRKARQLLTDQEISHLDYLNKRQKEFNNDIIPEVMDTRTKYEKLKNKDYINQQLRKMTYNLFDNDPKHSELFIQMFYIDNVNYSKFSTIYDSLVKQFKGTDALPSFVLQTAKQLIKNIVETGTPGGFNSNFIVENLQQLKEDLKDYKFQNRMEELEAKDKLNAVIYLFEDVFSNNSAISFNKVNNLTQKQFGNIKRTMSSTVDEIIKLLVSNDIDDEIKQENIVKLLNTIKDESIRQITTLLQRGEISLN